MTDTPKSHATESVEITARRAEQHHARLLADFQQSVAAEGETAFKRWGLPLYHSLSDEAVEAQRLAHGVQPTDALDFYNRGCLLASTEDFAGAAKAFARALELKPELSEAAFNHALALEKSGDAKGARKAWQAQLEALEDGSEDAEAIKEHLGSLAEA
jgi:tetratricopeptide (TPR) repeat protein